MFLVIAVAGVVNFILDTNFTGLKGEIQGGMSSRQDGDLYQAGLAWGRDFADGRGHVIASLEHKNIEGIREVGGRPWSAAGWGIIQNPNGPPSQIIVRDVRSANSAHGGLITNGPLCGPDL